MLVDLRSKGVTGKATEKLLDTVNITCNKNAIPNDPEKPFVTSGVRIGTPAVTSRGLKEDDMVALGKLIKLCATEFETKADYIREEITKIREKYPIYD
jgi:glycine hydroxymethyltransferase